MKRWYESKTIWVNIIAVLAFAIQKFYGKDLMDVQTQAILLAIINTGLRTITKHELS